MQNDVRLIDANALINVLCAKLRSIDNGRIMRQAAIPVADGMRIMELEYCIGLIQCADIIDAVPVVHAKWEIVHGMINPKYSGRKRCTRCGDISPNDMCCREMLTDYCPNCGAKMDAKDMDVPTKDGGAEG